MRRFRSAQKQTQHAKEDLNEVLNLVVKAMYPSKAGLLYPFDLRSADLGLLWPIPNLECHSYP